MTLKCICCGHEQQFKDAEEAFQKSWDAEPHFTVGPLCDLCPASLFILKKGHETAHNLWSIIGRPHSFAPHSCGSDEEVKHIGAMGVGQSSQLLQAQVALVLIAETTQYLATRPPEFRDAEVMLRLARYATSGLGKELLPDLHPVRLAAENASLRASLLNKRGDDLCWIEDPGKAKALPAEEFFESCRRYHAQLASERGELAVGQMTIAQLERRVLELEEDLELRDKGAPS